MSKPKFKVAKTVIIPIKDLRPHPENPRFIRNEAFEKLKKSMADFSDMVGVKPIIVNKENVILAGNMRCRAAGELGWLEMPAIVAEFKDAAAEREFMIKDNTHYGEFDFDVIANDWSDAPLDDWGLHTYGADAFTPITDPTQANGQVTPEDVEKAGAAQGQFNNVAETTDVICPKCAHEFTVNRL